MEKQLYEITINSSVDYEGKLNNHDDYIRMLSILERKCSFIGIDSFHEIVKKFDGDIIKTEKSSSWWGIETSFVNTLYYIKASKELFDYLGKYETFCKSINYKVEETNFGISDIAFFDENDNILLRTNTHEGFIFVDESIDKLFRINDNV